MSTARNLKDSELIAKRWADALMELALEDEGISKEDILDDLYEVSETIDSSNELSEILYNPSVSDEEKQLVLAKLFEGRLMPIVYKFIVTLNLRGRLNIIYAIAEAFRKRLENIKNILRVNITSAIELSEDKKNEIKNRISEKFRKNIVPEWKVDSDIIGGLILGIDETIIDNSIRKNLEKISKTIIKG